MKKCKMYKPCIFTQDYGTYSDEILVVSGITDKKKVFAYLKKIHALVPFSKWILTDWDEFQEKLKKNKGLFCWNTEVSGTVLFLQQCGDAWDFWTTLLHETNHIVFQIAHRKGMKDEMEAQAYLQEYLFNSIRRKLLGLDPLR